MSRRPREMPPETRAQIAEILRHVARSAGPLIEMSRGFMTGFDVLAERFAAAVPSDFRAGMLRQLEDIDNHRALYEQADQKFRAARDHPDQYIRDVWDANAGLPLWEFVRIAPRLPSPLRGGRPKGAKQKLDPDQRRIGDLGVDPRRTSLSSALTLLKPRNRAERVRLHRKLCGLGFKNTK